MGFLIALPFLLLLAAAQPPDEAPLVKARHADVVVLPAGRTSFAAGTSGRLRLEVRPKPGRSIYAPGQEGYVGFVLTFPPAAGIQPGTPVVPKAEPYVFEPTGERLEVFRKPFVIEQPVTFSRDSVLPIAATLRYQACDDVICYKPEDVRIEWRK